VFPSAHLKHLKDKTKTIQQRKTVENHDIGVVRTMSSNNNSSSSSSSAVPPVPWTQLAHYIKRYHTPTARPTRFTPAEINALRKAFDKLDKEFERVHEKCEPKPLAQLVFANEFRTSNDRFE
jgi:hypothetical protein